jgi:phosphoglycerol geranylgeranyltransferase
MSQPWTEWDHVLKIDPDKELVEGETFEDVVRTGTDAIEVGGTLDVTADKMQRVIDACRKYDVPLYQEPSDPSVVLDDDALAGYLVPMVLNAGHPFWLAGAHKEWVRLADSIDWTRTTLEAYVVLNPAASVAQLTEANCDQTAEDVASYATVAERFFSQEIVYVEYSGMLGDVEKVAAAANALDQSTLFYGGGIHDYESAHGMAEHADVVVVGDLVHDEGCEAVEATVRGTKDA